MNFSLPFHIASNSVLQTLLLRELIQFPCFSRYETAALGISLTCEPQKRYVVEYPEQFCSRTNIPAPFNEEPMIVNNACYKKCTSRKTTSGLYSKLLSMKSHVTHSRCSNA